MGFLTIDNDADPDILENAVVLKKLNYVIKKMYWEAFMDEIAENDEKYIKLLFLFHLGLSKMYLPTDEKEVAGGYIDILIEKGAYQGNVSYEWVVELKYVKVEDSKKENYMQKVRTEGMEQLNKYMSSDYIQNKYKETNLKSGLLIFKGKDEYEWIENI